MIRSSGWFDAFHLFNFSGGWFAYDLLHMKITHPKLNEWILKMIGIGKCVAFQILLFWVWKNSGGYVVSERTQRDDTPFSCWSKMCTYRWSWLILRVWILRDKESRTSTRQVSRVQNPGWLFYLEDDTTHLLYMGFIIIPWNTHPGTWNNQDLMFHVMCRCNHVSMGIYVEIHPRLTG